MAVWTGFVKKSVYKKIFLLTAILIGGIFIAAGFYFAPQDKKIVASLKLAHQDFVAASLSPQWSEKTGEVQSVPACNAADPMYSFNCVNGYPQTTIYWDACATDNNVDIGVGRQNSSSWIYVLKRTSCNGSYTFTAANNAAYQYYIYHLDSASSGHGGPYWDNNGSDIILFDTPQCCAPPYYYGQ